MEFPLFYLPQNEFRAEKILKLKYLIHSINSCVFRYCESVNKLVKYIIVNMVAHILTRKIDLQFVFMSDISEKNTVINIF